jgi:hypothetical protein
MYLHKNQKYRVKIEWDNNMLCKKYHINGGKKSLNNNFAKLVSIFINELQMNLFQLFKLNANDMILVEI